MSSSEMGHKAAATAAIEPSVLLRVLGICMVVFNHAAETVRPMELGGGVNILLVLSGFVFAQFVLVHETNRGLRRAIIKLALGIYLPCLAIILLSFAIKQEWSLSEVLFVSNMFSVEHVAVLYIWYPQAILQVLLLIYLATFIPGAADFLRNKPLGVSLSLLAVSFAAFMLIRSGPLDAEPGRMVQGLAWNFVLGWIVFFAASGRTSQKSGSPSVGERGAVVALTVGLALLAFGLGTHWLRSVALVSAVVVLLFVARLFIPIAAARVLGLVSQAAFAIYLWQAFFLRLFNALGLRQSPEAFNLGDVLLATIFTLTGSVAMWLTWTSLRRAWRFVRTNAAVAAPAPVHQEQGEPSRQPVGQLA